MISFFDYGFGINSNITRAIQHLGYDVILTCDDKDVQKAEANVLPGVGPVSNTHQTLPTILLV